MVGDGGFVESGGDRAVLLESVEAAFDDVAALVGEGVEGWWTAAGLAAPTSVGSLVAPLGDGGRDVPPAEFSADGLGGIAFVGDHPAGRGRWASGTRPPEPDACQDLAEHWCSS